VTPARIDLLPPLPLAVYRQRPVDRLPFPLLEPNCRLYSRARQGLRQGIPAVGLARGDEILVPAYHHGSEVEALVDAGIKCTFYDVGTTLAPEAGELESLITERTRALYLIHYLGFPQDAARWRAWCDDRDLLLFEDAAQAWLGSTDGRPLGAFGDLAIFCLYKTYGLADGAALISSSPPPVVTRRRRPGLARLARRHGRWVAGKSGLAAEFAARRQRHRPYHSEREFSLGDPSTPPARTSMMLLPRVAAQDAASRRRVNYQALLAELADSVPPALAQVPDGSSPHAFPIEIRANRDVFVAELARLGVRAFSFWSVPHPSLPATRFPGAARWRSTLVALPVHQELGPAELARVAAAARTARPRAEGVTTVSRVGGAITGAAT
jgi:dTDP-4-amino-4,6-dideoxygalactose transaminase